MNRATSTEQHHPHQSTYGATYRRLSEHGSFGTDKRARRPQTVCTLDVEEYVFNDIENNPGTSSRKVARHHGVRQRTVICNLHDNRYYP